MFFPLLIHSTGVLCHSFNLFSSYQVSFSFVPECCPNYIILFPSLSCFNQSVVSIIPHLTGVSSKCFHLAKFIFYAFHFQPECCHNWSLSFLVHLVSTGVLACTSCPLFSSFIALQTPRFTWRSLFLFSTGVHSYYFWSVKLLFHVLQPTRFSQCSLSLFYNGMFSTSCIFAGFLIQFV